MAPGPLPSLWAFGARDPRVHACDRSVSGLETVAGAFAYREQGDPFAIADQPTGPRLRIGLCSSLSWGFLRDLIRQVNAQPGAPALSFLEGTPRDLIKAAKRGEIDVGFVYGLHDWSQLQHQALWREAVMVLMPDHHPLASQSDVRPEALREETFLVTADPTERTLHMELLKHAIGGEPSAVLTIPVERATLINLVGLGFGLTLVSSSALGAFHPGVNYRPMAASPGPITFHAIWRRSNDNKELARFLDAACALAGCRRA